MFRRALVAIAAILLGSSFLFGPAFAAAPNINLTPRVAALEAQVANLNLRVTALEAAPPPGPMPVPVPTPSPIPSPTPPAPSPVPIPSPTPSPSPVPSSPPACPASLQGAINATAVGGTFTVGSCVFYESVTIDKAMTLRGPATLDGGGTLKYGIVVAASGVTVDGLTVTHYANPVQDGAIHVWNVSNATIANVHSTYNAGACISLQNVSDSIVRNSEFAYCAQEGYHGTLLTNVTFSRNSIHHNNPSRAYDPFWEAGGGKTTRTRNVLFEDNLSYANVGPGLWCDIDCQTTTFRGNLVHDNTLSGIMYEISSSGLIEGNTVYRNGKGDGRGWGWPANILVSSSRTTIVRNNVVAFGLVGIAFIGQNRPDGPQPYDGLSATGNVVTASDPTPIGRYIDFAGTLSVVMTPNELVPDTDPRVAALR